MSDFNCISEYTLSGTTAVSFKLKTETDLYDLAKAKTVPCTYAIPNIYFLHSQFGVSQFIPPLLIIPPPLPLLILLLLLLLPPPPPLPLLLLVLLAACYLLLAACYLLLAAQYYV